MNKPLIVTETAEKITYNGPFIRTGLKLNSINTAYILQNFTYDKEKDIYWMLKPNKMFSMEYYLTYEEP